MLLYSGGKDSSYVLHRLVEEGYRVIAFTFDNGHISPAAFRNIERQTERLGVPCIVRKTPKMNEIFVQSLLQDQTVCSGCFRALTTISTRLAKEYGVNVVITGLSRGQIFETKLEGLFQEGIHDVGDIERQLVTFRRVYHASRDETSRLIGDSLGDVAFDETQFVDYFRYDNTPVTRIKNFLAKRDEFWQQPGDTGFCSSNCMMNDIGIGVHSKERGFHNYEAPISWDIRFGIVEREDGLHEVESEIDIDRVNNVLQHIGYLKTRVRDAAVIVHEPEPDTHWLCAYFTASGPLTVTELRAFLASRLPAYMVPSHFIQMDALPLNRNGKVDRKELPLPEGNRPPMEESHIPARNEIEQTLVDIWRSVLKVSRLGVRDNFFDLGGDSITAIRIVAQANEAGLRITPAQMLTHQTVDGLASVALTTGTSSAEQGSVTGSVKLTPIQQWFFEQGFAEPHQCNQSLIVACPGSITRSDIDTALADVVQHHDMLRTRFEQTDAGWTATIQEEAEPCRLVDASSDDLDHTEESLQRSLDLYRGRLFAGAVTDARQGVRQLLLIVHHLVVDAVSWPIVLADLSTAVRQRSSGEPVDLPRKSTSFKQWARGLDATARQLEARTRDYWIRSPADVGRLPCDRHSCDPKEATTSSISVTLSRRETEQLLHELPRQRYVQPHEALLAAFAAVLRRWTRNNHVLVELEGHGREDLVPDTDLTRTVGWFTTRYPLILDLTEAHSPTALLKAVKDQARQVPHRGASYGVLRYLCRDHALRQQLATQAQPEVLFNYLGHADQLVPESSLFTLARPLTLSRGPANRCTRLIELNAAVVDGALRADWTYNRERHDSETVEKQARDFLVELRRFLAETDGEQPSASDFPLANLNKSKFKKLAQVLGRLT